MVQFCVLVKGPCRGKMCDFWARIKIRKRSLDDLVVGLLSSIAQCPDQEEAEIDATMKDYWLQLGVKNRSRLCNEEPDLCEKMRRAEEIAARQLLVARH
jgi:hypothetical protein